MKYELSRTIIEVDTTVNCALPWAKWVPSEFKISDPSYVYVVIPAIRIARSINIASRLVIFMYLINKLRAMFTDQRNQCIKRETMDVPQKNVGGTRKSKVGLTPFIIGICG